MDRPNLPVCNLTQPSFGQTTILLKQAQACGGLHELMTRYGRDNWCVFVDIDEQLVAPGVEHDGLRPLLDEMRERGEEVMFGFMLDMFPDNLAVCPSFNARRQPPAIRALLRSRLLGVGAR